MKRILCIDGGGIKGTVPASMLAHIEEATNKRIVDYFDLIVGTSTGGIIALGLGAGFTARNILDFYKSFGPSIFNDRTISSTFSLIATKYSPNPLRDALQKTFGDKILGVSSTRLVVPAFHADRRTVRLFKTRHHERLLFDHKESIVNVAMSTAAAPTFFPAHQLPVGGNLIDGGIWANCPILVAVVEALTVLGWDPEELRVLSLGCTDDVFKVKTVGGKWDYREAGVQMILHAQTQGAIAMASLLMHDRGPQYKRLLRVNPPVPEGEYPMADASKIYELSGIGEDLGRNYVESVSLQFLERPVDPFIPFPENS